MAQLTATCGEYFDFCLKHELGTLQMEADLTCERLDYV